MLCLTFPLWPRCDAVAPGLSITPYAANCPQKKGSRRAQSQATALIIRAFPTQPPTY